MLLPEHGLPELQRRSKHLVRLLVLPLTAPRTGQAAHASQRRGMLLPSTFLLGCTVYALKHLVKGDLIHKGHA